VQGLLLWMLHAGGCRCGIMYQDALPENSLRWSISLLLRNFENAIHELNLPASTLC
jgi:hypothetical protein